MGFRWLNVTRHPNLRISGFHRPLLLKLKSEMATFAGILSLRAPLRLQNRVFLINGVRKSGAVRCLGSREYGSSIPTRYIPKKSSKGYKEERSSPTNGCEEHVPRRANANAMRFGLSHEDKGGVAKVILSNKERWDSNDKRNPMNSFVIGSSLAEKGFTKTREVVQVDDEVIELPFSEMEDEMSHDQEARDDEFMTGPVESGEEHNLDKENICKRDVPFNGKTRKDASDMAIQLLATRAYTAVEMRKKLHGKRFAPAIIDSVIDDFERRGLINDTLYAETFSQSRWSSSCWGPRRIKQVL
ncbi:uncharacterized protein LOC116214760 isoform X2 [Punica granatum]|uniref:Uncharacterized protein LOC116214760 isoform X2 n=1 Tax=Punica granatum TaxID=22663 RepID=A0A6P8EI02_PUNGR|nr:uncharacterized protein LOC116214760 isoform X2 [Punica granatum]